VKSARDWSVRRHRTLPRALGLTRAVAVGLAVVAVVAGVVAVASRRAEIGADPNAAGAWNGASASPSAAPKPSVSASPPPAAAPVTSPPTQLKIEAIHLTTDLEPLGLDDKGRLSPPGFDDAGWYADGTAPGDAGPAVIAGHIDSKSGPSVFYHLHELKTGDIIQVKRGAAWIRFAVTDQQQYPKTAFPTAKVYGPTATAQLRLITCGGTFDKSVGSYEDNVIVFAVMTG
jgi:LPXTG-site transpeptidase (sortase) family protein